MIEYSQFIAQELSFAYEYAPGKKLDIKQNPFAPDDKIDAYSEEQAKLFEELNNYMFEPREDGKPKVNEKGEKQPRTTPLTTVDEERMAQIAVRLKDITYEIAASRFTSLGFADGGVPAPVTVDWLKSHSVSRAFLNNVMMHANYHRFPKLPTASN